MYTVLVSVSVLVCLCAARPQEAPTVAATAPNNGKEPIQIVSQTDENNPDGSFNFSFEAANGIKFEEKGYLKDGANASDKIQVIEGSVSYTDNEGNPVTLKFIADENGFQPQGDHIPKAPESQSPAEAKALPSAGTQPAPASAQPAVPAPADAQPAEPGPDAAQSAEPAPTA
ncbi:larval cuticle protein 1-like [Diorhabda carinulata]|uniref:larval cuticle protein 1-like n=1 Tax=Diorhabda carinulata TaxID=1163345 RepID=UPI0025A190BF|nr:larval cuticle protein 1-like [Diorhabda carinulata]